MTYNSLYYKQYTHHLCYFAGKAFDIRRKPKTELPTTSLPEKEKYLKEAKVWAKNLAETFDLPNGEFIIVWSYKKL